MEKRNQTREHIENFLLRNKYYFIFIAALIIIVGIALPLYLNQKEKQSIGAIEEFEILEDAYSEFTSSYNFYKEDEDIDQEEIDELVNGYNEIISKYPEEIAAQKANLHIAVIYSITQNYEEALKYYEQAVEFKTQSYLTPRALFNMAAIQENLEQKNEAIASYKRIVDEFPVDLLSPHAMFNLARLHEDESQDLEDALAFYQLLISNEEWEDSPWVNVAKSRLAALNMLEKTNASAEGENDDFTEENTHESSEEKK